MHTRGIALVLTSSSLQGCFMEGYRLRADPDAAMRPDASISSDAGSADVIVETSGLDGSGPDGNAGPQDANAELDALPPRTLECDTSLCLPTKSCAESCSGASCMPSAPCTHECAHQRQCASTCQENRNCVHNCTDTLECETTCRAGATCEVYCVDADYCSVTCEPGSTCKVLCFDEERCDVTCMEGADCRMTCSNFSPGSCDFELCAGGQQSCIGSSVCGSFSCP
jgi:hypothetical protein